MGGRKFSKTDILGFFLIATFSLLSISLLFKNHGKNATSSPVQMDSDTLMVKAAQLEESGNIQDALTLYREAITLKPALCDPKSGEFLGKDFEEKINRWIRELKSGARENRGKSLENAAYIFRKLNGGCG